MVPDARLKLFNVVFGEFKLDNEEIQINFIIVGSTFFEKEEF